jgi:phosphatidylglycerol:prolipoprotein diacylglycerol transferase
MYPVLLTLGPATIYTFGAFLFFGFFLASFIIWRRLRDQGWEEEKIIDFLFLAALAGLIISRIFFVATNFDLGKDFFGWPLSRLFFLGGGYGCGFSDGLLYSQKSLEFLEGNG